MTNALRRVAYAAIVSAALHSPLNAGDEGGGTTSPFNLGAGGRTIAMGGAASSVWGDSYAALWNPAGLCAIDRNEASLFHTSLFDESTTYSSLMLAHPFVDLGVFSFGVVQLRVGGIEWRDAENTLIDGEIENIQTRYLIGYARDIAKGFTAGTSLKLDRYSEGSYVANGFGIDAGLGLEPSVHSPAFDGMAMGISFVNILEPTVRLAAQEAGDPRAIRAGISFWRSVSRTLDDRLTVAVDIDRARYSETRFHAGAEYGMRRTFAVRAGWDAGIPTLGCGLRLPFFLLDYAYRSTDLGGNHLFSLTYRFGASRDEKIERVRRRREEEIRRELDAQVSRHESTFIASSLESGKASFAAQDFGAAMDHFGRVLLWSPANEVAREGVRAAQSALLMIRGDSLMTRGKLAEALLSYREAFSQLRSPQASERIEHCETMIRKTADNDRLNRDILAQAIELYAERNWTGAEAGFREALALDPQNAAARGYLSKTRDRIRESRDKSLGEADRLAAGGRYGAALQLLKAENERNPGDERLAAKIRELDALRADAEKRKSADAAAAGTEKELGAEERERYRKAYDRGIEFFKRGDFARAIEAWEGVRRASARFEQVSEYLVKAYQYLGMEHYARHEYEKALDTWSRVLAVDPDNEKALRYIGKTREELSRLEGRAKREVSN